MSFRSRSTLLPILLTLVGAAGINGCGGSDPTAPTPVVAIIGPLAPVSATDSFPFAATVDGVPGAPVIWGVLEGGIGGTISAAGEYHAPVTAGTYHVVATTPTSPHGADTAAVIVVLPVVVITGPGGPLAVSDSFNFTAKVDGDAGVPVTWSVVEGAPGGSFGAGGKYYTPAVGGTFHVVATRVALPHVADTIVVTVLSDPAPSFTSFPDSIEALTGQPILPFTVGSATGLTNVWSVSGGSFSGGTPTASGGSIQATDTAAAYLVVSLQSTNAVGRSTTIKDSARVLGHAIFLPDATYEVAISSTNVLASIEGSDDIIRFRNVADRGITHDVHVVTTPNHGVFSPDGATFVVGLQGSDQLAKINVAAGTSTTVPLGHTPYNVGLAESGNVIYVTTADGWIFKLAATTLTKLDSVRVYSASNGVAARGGALWVATMDGRLYSIDTLSFDLVDSVTVGGGYQRIALNSDASKLYAANELAGELDVITTATKAVATVPMNGGGPPVGVALTPDGSEVWVAVRSDGHVYRFHTSDLTSAGSVVVGGSPRDITVSPDGHYTLIGAESFSFLLRE